MNITLNNRKALSCIVIASMTMYLLKLITGNDIFLTLYICLSISSIVPMILIKANVSIKYLVSVLLSISIIIFFSFFSSSYDLQSAFIGATYITTTVILLWATHESRNELFIARFIFYSLLVYIAPFIVTYGISNPDAYNDILSGASRNMVSALIIVFSCFHIASYVKLKRKYPIFVPLASFVCCFMLFGRSGIVISFFILSICAINVFDKKYTAILLCMIAFLVVYYYVDISEYIMTKTNFAVGTDSQRSTMLSQYTSNMSLSDVVFGNEYSRCCSEIVRFDNNPHNSFLNGHARYGLSHAIIVLSLVAIAFKKSTKLSIALLIAILSRYSVDQIGLFSPIDLVILYLVFCCPRQSHL